MLTVIRDREAPRRDFIASVDRLCRFVVEEGLNHIPMIEKTIFTPSVEKSLRDIIPDIRIAKVLVQRDPKTKEANLFYSKFPPNIAEQFCLVMDPILATGGSAIAAIEALCLNGVQVSNIIFLCIVSCPEGLNALTTRFPKIKIITSTVGDHLDERKYVIPDTFDIGCRYYGTD
ncbi:Uracil phosphoribosyltransferase, synthesizes UMP from uracil [Lunasporangiospora selenospora]|uniref:Uracil phosphoribosyltransferase, synthesizes UMP from uracil n=1 Tax=Lunasporangiospora selenospora TaxID=979761 RepID=A0A9P6KGR6_9FUNG|nr:Uracil phosphoribosyltransferase, synthesizes UMP from uracil [Lunasporangiospora selenospora]